MAEHLLDVTGLSCPLPVLRAKKALKALQPGDELVVLATDPASVIDFEVFSSTSGNPLVTRSEEPGGVFRFVLRRG